jgi:hypothetical protein
MDTVLFVIFTDPLDNLRGPLLGAYAINSSQSILFWIFKTWDQFHQRFTSSFCLRKSLEHKKTILISLLSFVLMGSAGVKVLSNHVDKIDH